MMLKVLLFALLITSTFAVRYENDVYLDDLEESNDIWSDCSQPGDHLKINSFTVTPDPPKIGQNVTVSLKGTLDEAVTNVTAHVVVNYYGAKLVDITKPLCGAIPEFKCPIAKGEFDLTLTETVPGITPPGKYTGKAQIYDQNNDEMACISIDVDMEK